MRKLLLASSLPMVMTFVSAVPLSAQTTQTSASQFYIEYRAAFAKAEVVEDLIPYMSASRRKQIESTPAEERKKMFDVMKILGALSNVKIVKETRTDTGATLTVDALDSDNAKTTGTITLIREDGAWKIDKERFSSSSS